MTRKSRKSMYTFMIVVVVGVGLAAYLMLPRFMSVGVAGTVSAIDPAGIATIKTVDGQEHRITGEGWKIGEQVECAMEHEKLICKKS